MLVAIDAHISPDVAGGTETALLSLIRTLALSEGPERYLLLAMHAFAERLKSRAGHNQEVLAWPTTYRWFKPEVDGKPAMTTRWQRLKRIAGPLGPAVERLHAMYARSDATVGPRARRAFERFGIPMPVGERLYRLYRALGKQRSQQDVDRSHDRLLRRHGVAAIHFPYPLHFSTALPFVYEPWGLPHFHFPELYPEGEAEWMDDMFRDGCERAAVIVTATRWVKEDILRRYDIPASRIAVIPRAPHVDDVCPAPRTEIEGLYSLPDQFAYFPAMTLPTKNHIGLIRALAALKSKHGIRLNVVCTGRHNTSTWPAIAAELASTGLGTQVRFLGTVPYAHVQALFSRARFLVFPSLFEGLGLPLMEAFYFGLPVVAARAACIPEVVGDAGLLFDPYDTDAFSAVLLEAATNDALLADLRARAVERLRDFPTAAQVARMFVVCYRKAAGCMLPPAEQRLYEDMAA